EDPILDQLEATESLAGEAALTLPQYYVAWSLAQPDMASLIVGLKSLAQLEVAVEGAKASIPAEILVKQDAITPPPYRHRAPFSRPHQN
ncbi:MAG: hypothetical protein F7B06_11130, partial [Opitutae bacterium]|nr:hypothetical protein [Opitutae bacterium]